MKIIKKYQNGYADILAENARESLYEKGDYIEVDSEDYRIIDYKYKDNKPLYQAVIV